MTAEGVGFGGWLRYSGEGDGGVFEVFAEKALDEGAQVFAGFRENEAVGASGPVEFEAGGLGGDPDLANGCVGGEDEFSGSVLEEDVEDAMLLLGFKAAGFFGSDEGLLEGGQGGVGFAAEGGFVDERHCDDFTAALSVGDLAAPGGVWNRW